MKKVIRGRLYDTERARPIGSVFGTGETLYRKRTGEYFLGAGDRIKPLAYDAARKWAENALDGDEVAAEFGDPEENMDKQILNLSITVCAVEIVKKAAQKKGKSVSETIEALIRENLA